MKLPKIVLKKTAQRRGKEAQLGVLDRQPSRISSVSATGSSASVSRSNDIAESQRQQKQQQQQQQQAGPSPRTVKATLTNAFFASPPTQRKTGAQATAASFPRAAAPRRHEAGLDSSFSSSAASSQYGDGDSTSDDDGRSSQSSASSFSRATSHSSLGSSTQSSCSRSMSTSAVGAAPAVPLSETTAAKAVPRTQYSAYARKMKTASRRRRAPPRSNSAIDFDDADEFFDKSDSSLGVGSSLCVSPGSDVARGALHSDDDVHRGDDAMSDEEDEEEEACMQMQRGPERQPYRNGIPMGRRMTQKEIQQRRVKREREEALLSVRTTRTQRGGLPSPSGAASTRRAVVGLLNVADLPQQRQQSNSPRSTRSNSNSNSNSSGRSGDAPALTATSATAPVVGEAEQHTGIGSGSAGRSAAAPPVEKKATGLLGWRRKLLGGSHKPSRSGSTVSRDDGGSPLNRSVTSTTSNSNSNSNSNSASSPTAANRSTKARTVGGDGGAAPSRSSASASLSRSPQAKASIASASSSTTPNGGSSSTRNGPASASPASAAARASAPAAVPVPLDDSRPISKETLRSLSNRQLSRLDFSAQKARKTVRHDAHADDGMGPLSAGPTASLISNGGYGSFMDVLAAVAEDDDDGDMEADRRSTGSRSSRRSSASAGSRRSNRSSTSARSASSGGQRRSLPSSQRRHREKPHGAFTAREKPPARSGSFFRSLFRSNSGVSKNGGRNSPPGDAVERRGSSSAAAAAAAASARQHRTRPSITVTTTRVGRLAGEKSGAHATERPLLSRQALQRALESPGSDASGLGTSLYHMESDCSAATMTTTTTGSSSSHNNSTSSSGSSFSIGAHAAQHREQLLRRSRQSPHGPQREGSRMDGHGTMADVLMRPQTDLGMDDSFGSLFKADGGHNSSSATSGLHAGDGGNGNGAATTVAATLYGTPRLTPSEFGSAPTPGGSAIGAPLEVAMAAVAPKGIVSGGNASPSPSSRLQPTPSINSGALFPPNSYPRALDAAAGLGGAAGSGVAKTAAAAGAGGGRVPGAASTNAVNSLWHPQLQQKKLLSQLDPPARRPGAEAAATAVGQGAPTSTNAMGGGASMAVKAGERGAASAASAPSSNTHAAANAAAAAGSASPSVGVVASGVSAVSAVSPTPLLKEFVGQPSGAAATSPPQTSLDGDSTSQRGRRDDTASRSHRHARRHRHHHNGDDGDGDDAMSTGRTSRHSGVARKSSLLSVTDGFRVRGRENGAASGTSNSGDHRAHHRTAATGESLAKKASGSSSRGSNSHRATAAHPPNGQPPSGDPRRSDNSRHGGSGSGGAHGSTGSAGDAGGEQKPHRASATITVRPARTSSGSLLPQPPTLSNTESKNYRGRGAPTTAGGGSGPNSSSATGPAGNSFNAAIAALQGSDAQLPTRADSKDFLLRNDTEGNITVTTTTATNTTAGVASPQRPSRESSKRHRPRKTSTASTRYDDSFSSESLLDGKARGRLAKAAAASNAASSSAERRRGPSSNGSVGGSGPDGGEGSTSKRRLHTRDQMSTSARALQHFRDEDGEAPQRQERHHRHRHHHHRGDGGSDAVESSGSQRRRRGRGDLYGSSRRPSSASVSLVAGLDEVLPHRPMQSRNASSSSAFSSSAAPSSRNSSASSGDRHGEAVGRNSVRCLRKMAAKARDVSASSSCDLEGRAASSRGESGFHIHTKVMQQMSDPHGSSGGAQQQQQQQQLVRAQQSNSSTNSAAASPHFALGNGSGTLITSNPNGGAVGGAGAYAMKLPSFKPSIVGESSSSNDVSTDRPTNSGGSRQQHQQQQHQQTGSGNGSDGAAQQLQRMPLTMSHEGGGAMGAPRKGSGTYLLLPTRPAGSNGNGRASHNTNASSTNEGVLGAGDRVMTSVDQHRQAGTVAGGPSHGLVQPPPCSTGAGGGGGESKGDAGAGAGPAFVAEGGVQTSVPTALLAQPRDANAKRRRPATENFTPWSVDMSRFDKLRQAQSTSPPST